MADQEGVSNPAADDPSKGKLDAFLSDRWILFLSGFLVLFLELACIRWFAANVIFLQFFTNVALIAAFVGMSIGCLAASSRSDWLARFPMLAFGTTFLAVVSNFLYNAWSTVEIDVYQSAPEVVFFGTEYRRIGATNDPATFFIPLEAFVGIYFFLILLLFVGVGQVLGRAFVREPNRVMGYTFNIAGSIAGILAFSGMSALQAPPLAWFAGSFFLVGVLLKSAGTLSRQHVVLLIGALGIVASTDYSQGAITRWSPYYKILFEEDELHLVTNAISHQQIVPQDKDEGSIYSLIHLLQRDSNGEPFRNVLVIGAGTGNDVARTLHFKPELVDAVEIDPVIQEIGVQYNPDRPYQDERVRVQLGDGRNFLHGTDRKYDLVIYALVDSLILHSSYSSLRLESFLFTEDAFEDVRRVLDPEDGIFVMYNFYRQGWIVERIAQMARNVFGSEPIVISLPYTDRITAADSTHGRYTMIIAGKTDRIREAFEKNGDFWLHQIPLQWNDSINGFQFQPEGDITAETTRIEEWSRIRPAEIPPGDASILVSRDDWPFLYLKERSVPWLYLRGMLVLMAIAIGVLIWLAPDHRVSLNGRMFFLGAGFMLLETKAVVHLALVFGSTWLVNSAVFLGILVMVLASNLFVLKVRNISLIPFYLGLGICLALNIFLPLNLFLDGGPIWKYGGSCLLLILPVFFAGVIFAVSFRDSQHPDQDFGANIAGSVVGGLAENMSMLLGFRHLLWLAIAFYALSAFSRGRRP